MIKGKECSQCIRGMVNNSAYDEGSFSPPTMPCVHCKGTGYVDVQPQNKEEVAVMFADAYLRYQNAKEEMVSKRHLYSRWKHGVNRDEDGHRL